jgi:hypothetical protein
MSTAPIRGPNTVPCPTDDDREEKQNRLDEGKGAGANERRQLGEECARQAGGCSGQCKRHSAQHQRIETKRLCCHIGVADRPQSEPPRAHTEPPEQPQQDGGASDSRSGHVAIIEEVAEGAGERDVHQAIGAPSQTAPFDRTVFDDEPEGDRHHGEIGPGHP